MMYPAVFDADPHNHAGWNYLTGGEHYQQGRVTAGTGDMAFKVDF